MEDQEAMPVVTDHDKGTRYIYELALKLLELNGSDIFITAGSPPALKVNQEIHRVGTQIMTPQQTSLIARSIMHDRQAKEFDQNNEVNFSLNFPNIARFRVNAFTQRGSAGLVMRLVKQKIPTLEELNLPAILREIAMTQRGLVIFLGGTGCGKTTSMASMLDYRNRQCREHIITIEDPIEFFHRHQQCLVEQREVGTDTESYEVALKNTLRQAPNVILIGECRDRETMEAAINFAETGHLCITTLHANNTDQAFDRIVNFFPDDKRAQVLMDLSFNMKAGLIPAVEVLLNTPLMAELIFQGRVKELKSIMTRSSEQGIITFDQALFDLYEAGRISYAIAIRQADSANNLRLRIKLEGKRQQPQSADLASLEIEAEQKVASYRRWEG